MKRVGDELQPAYECVATLRELKYMPFLGGTTTSDGWAAAKMLAIFYV